MQIILANPQGFCAGVKRAIKIVENALKIYGAPIYVRHELVHNKYVIDDLTTRGIIFIEHINEVPDNSILIFSAHGVSQKVRKEANKRSLTIFDATCPLVARVHMKVARASKHGKELIFIGHAGHPEVESTLGQYSNKRGGIYLVESSEDIFKLKVKNKAKLSFVTQTTLSVNKTLNIVKTIYKTFPEIIKLHDNDICYATINRQKAASMLTKLADLILVIGSKNSSNSNRLVELVKQAGKVAFLINDASEIKENWIENVSCIGITSGASAPNFLVQEVIIRLQNLGGNEVLLLDSSSNENIKFKIPKELRI